MTNLTKSLTNLTDIGQETSEILVSEHDNDSLVVLAVSLIGLVITVGCTGNIMVLLAVRKIKKLQTVSNIFVMNLSVCDLLFVGCVLPFNIYTYISDGWFIDTSLCKFVGFIGYILTGTTIITITLIAYNRYKLILDPGAYRQLYTQRNIIIMLVCAWIVPVACLIPALIGVWGKFGYVVMLVTCNLLLDHKSQTFKIFLMLVRAGIPCVLIVYYYARIYHATTTSHRRLNRNSRGLSTMDIHNQRKEMHMTRMMLMIFLVFIISYFPCTITGMVDWNTVLSKEFHMFCQISVYLGSAINPLVYGLMNSQFRQGYAQLLFCWKHKAMDIKKSGINTTSTKDVKGSTINMENICLMTIKKLTKRRSSSSPLKKDGKYLSIITPSTPSDSQYSSSPLKKDCKYLSIITPSTPSESQYNDISNENSRGKRTESLPQISMVKEDCSNRPKFTLQ